MKVGIGPLDYSSYRAFQNAPVPGARMIRVPYLPVRRIALLSKRIAPFAQSVGLFLPLGRADLLHSYNAVLLNSTPWVVSFECQFPRIWNSPRFASYLLSRAAASSCKKVIAMSQNARTHMVIRNRNDPSLEAVLKKTTVIHPLLEDDQCAYENRFNRAASNSFHIVFIGNEFFRKGGTFAVEAFEVLRKRYAVRMTVVSTLSTANEFFPVSPAELDRWKDRMTIAGVESLQNQSSEQIRKLLSTADVLLLPTLEDSFGYSMVEAMATGVAVVATGVEAVPEIIEHNKTGLVIEVPLTEERRILWSKETGELVTKRLIENLSRLLEQPGRVNQMGRSGRERYEKLFHPNVVGKALAMVYEEALTK
jgi:glycosyltransferase involved in cell wall biosynthesis